MNRKTTVFAAAIIAVGAVSATATTASARDQIKIVGSSTVFPFSTTVAERFGKNTDFPTPVVESTGSGGGLKLFCAGVGTEHPDITNASRRIKKSEVELCAKNGVEEIVEVKVGYDGIVLANSRKADPYKLTLKDIFTALAKDLPDGKGGSMPNPNMTWNQVNADLPAVKIEVLGPPPTSGTRDAFVELAMEAGCEEYEGVKDMEKGARKVLCQTVREDGGYVEAGENDNLIVNKLNANPNALGIFGFSFLDQNSDKVQGSIVNGESPEFEKIADGSYPVSRSLYFYVKKAHIGVVPGIEEFLAEFIGDAASGEDGYLAEKGLIPMGEEEAAEWKAKVEGLENLSM